MMRYCAASVLCSTWFERLCRRVFAKHVVFDRDDAHSCCVCETNKVTWLALLLGRRWGAV